MKQTNEKISKAFAKGLAAGFAGKSAYKKIKRGIFPVESSSFDKEGIFYIDQWMPSRLGGGQELLEVDDKRYTRVYAGGTVDIGKLKKLGISEADVMNFLKQSLLAAKEKTRFDHAYSYLDGAWTYAYAPAEDTILGVVTGREIISYKNTPVFVHFFIISPVAK